MCAVNHFSVKVDTVVQINASFERVLLIGNVTILWSLMKAKWVISPAQDVSCWVSVTSFVLINKKHYTYVCDSAKKKCCSSGYWLPRLGAGFITGTVYFFCSYFPLFFYLPKSTLSTVWCKVNVQTATGATTKVLFLQCKMHLLGNDKWLSGWHVHN